MRRRSRRNNGHAHGSPIGREMGMSLAQPYDVQTAMLDTANACGLGWLRTDVQYGFHANQAAADVAIANAGATGLWPELLPYKAQWDAAHARGVKILVVCQGSLSWVRGADRTDGGNVFMQAPLPSKRSYFAEFVRQLALSGVDALEFWNEPNFKSSYWLGPDHPRAAFPAERVDDYVLLMRQVYARLKGDPLTAPVPLGIGATGLIGHELLTDPNGIQHTIWYGKLFTAKADDRVTPVSISGAFDMACVHPYANVSTFEGPLAWGATWLSAGDAALWHGMASVYRQRAVLIANGHADKKFWATELGAPTNGQPGQSWLNESQQASWLTEYVRAWFSTAPSGFAGTSSPTFYGSFTGPLIVYQWKDKTNGVIPPIDTEGYFGLLRYDGSAKQSLVTLAAEAKRVRGNF